MPLKAASKPTREHTAAESASAVATKDPAGDPEEEHTKSSAGGPSPLSSPASSDVLSDDQGPEEEWPPPLSPEARRIHQAATVVSALGLRYVLLRCCLGVA